MEQQQTVAYQREGFDLLLSVGFRSIGFQNPYSTFSSIWGSKSDIEMFFICQAFEGNVLITKGENDIRVLLGFEDTDWFDLQT